MQCRKFRKGKKTAKKMRRRKLQKKCNSENATLEIAFFLHFLLHLFWCRSMFFCIFSFFFVKQYTSWSKLQKNAAEKMQRRKLEVAFFLHFPFRMNCLCMYRIFVSLHPFAFHYTPPPNPSSRPCPSPQLHLTLSAFHACSLLFTPLSPSTLSSEQEWRCWVEAEMDM